MDMTIDETRRECISLSIDHMCGLIFEGFCSFLCPYINDAIAFDRDCLCMRICLIACEYSGVGNNDIGRWHTDLLKNILTTSVGLIAKRAAAPVLTDGVRKVVTTLFG